MLATAQGALALSSVRPIGPTFVVMSTSVVPVGGTSTGGGPVSACRFGVGVGSAGAGVPSPGSSPPPTHPGGRGAGGGWAGAPGSGGGSGSPVAGGRRG